MFRRWPVEVQVSDSPTRLVGHEVYWTVRPRVTSGDLTPTLNFQEAFHAIHLIIYCIMSRVCKGVGEPTSK